MLSGSTAVMGGTAVLTDPYHGYGTADIFGRTGQAWHRQQAINATAASEGLGWGVAIQGGTLVIGGQGWAYVYNRTRSGWRRTQVLTGPPVRADSFGWSVAISGTRILVGDPTMADFVGHRCGRAFEYEFIAGRWRETDHLVSPHKARQRCPVFDDFGWNVALSGRTALVSNAVTAYILKVR